MASRFIMSAVLISAAFALPVICSAGMAEFDIPGAVAKSFGAEDLKICVLRQEGSGKYLFMRFQSDSGYFVVELRGLKQNQARHLLLSDLDGQYRMGDQAAKMKRFTSFFLSDPAQAEKNSQCETELRIEGGVVQGSFSCRKLWNIDQNLADAQGRFECALQ